MLLISKSESPDQSIPLNLVGREDVIQADSSKERVVNNQETTRRNFVKIGAAVSAAIAVYLPWGIQAWQAGNGAVKKMQNEGGIEQGEKLIGNLDKAYTDFHDKNKPKDGLEMIQILDAAVIWNKGSLLCHPNFSRCIYSLLESGKYPEQILDLLLKASLQPDITLTLPFQQYLIALFANNQEFSENKVGTILDEIRASLQKPSDARYITYARINSPEKFVLQKNLTTNKLIENETSSMRLRKIIAVNSELRVLEDTQNQLIDPDQNRAPFIAYAALAAAVNGEIPKSIFLFQKAIGKYEEMSARYREDLLAAAQRGEFPPIYSNPDVWRGAIKNLKDLPNGGNIGPDWGFKCEKNPRTKSQEDLVHLFRPFKASE